MNMNASARLGSACINSQSSFPSLGRRYRDIFSKRKVLLAHPLRGFGTHFGTFAMQKSEKKLNGDGKASKTKYLRGKSSPLKDKSDKLSIEDEGSRITNNGDTLGAKKEASLPTRSAVLQACIITSSLLLALGALIRQVSHAASITGFGIIDASVGTSLDFEMWHIELIVGLVILVSSSRYLLLKTWPDFSESSEAANQQVLGSLQPLDYVVVAFLPGISEELLFRGALLPLFGLNWKSALLIGAVFGSLHLGSGRRYSFAIWATLVGFAYGLATVASSSVIVPMASHSLNNLIGGILWRYTSAPKDELD